MLVHLSSLTGEQRFILNLPKLPLHKGQPARASVSLRKNISFVHFIHLGVGFREASPGCSALRELKYGPKPGTAATQTNGCLTGFTSSGVKK